MTLTERIMVRLDNLSSPLEVAEVIADECEDFETRMRDLSARLHKLETKNVDE